MHIAANVVVRVNELPRFWRDKANERRQLTSIDPAADALELAAKELERAIAEENIAGRRVGTTEFARLKSVLPATVRKWCAKGWLAGATKNVGGDWDIPANA